MATIVQFVGGNAVSLFLQTLQAHREAGGEVNGAVGYESTIAYYGGDGNFLPIGLEGEGFTYSNGALATGIVAELRVVSFGDPACAFAGFEGLSAEEAMSLLNGNDALLYSIIQTTQWNYFGSDVADNFSSGELNDVLNSGAGADILYGNGGNDTINDGADRDTLYGGSGNDKLTGGTGVDTVYGGTGNDTFFVDSNFDKVRESAGEGRDLVISTGSFTLHASAEVEFLRTANAAGNLGFFLTGNDFAQTITGNAGSNSLKGFGGNDTLIGMSGADELYGGAGADTFMFQTIAQSTLSTRDMIYDFSRVEGDKIDLSAIDARTTTAGNQAFTFLGTAEFSGNAGQLRYLKKDGDTYIHGDVNGDKGIDFSIRFDSTIDLKSTDFIL